jgi:hypothetical protein
MHPRRRARISSAVSRLRKIKGPFFFSSILSRPEGFNFYSSIVIIFIIISRFFCCRACRRFAPLHFAALEQPQCDVKAVHKD